MLGVGAVGQVREGGVGVPCALAGRRGRAPRPRGPPPTRGGRCGGTRARAARPGTRVPSQCMACPSEPAQRTSPWDRKNNFTTQTHRLSGLETFTKPPPNVGPLIFVARR